MSRTEELRAHLTIRRGNLDEELIRQPQLFYEAGEAYALAVSRRESAKDALKQVAAELYLRLRRKLADKERVTEATLNANVETHPEHAAARVAFAEAQAEVEAADALKEAYSQRAWMLKELCALHLAGYFSKQSVDGPDPRQVVDSAAESARMAMNEKRRSRTRMTAT